VTESTVQDFKLTRVQCSATASIHLVADEHVTCVYTNTYQEPSGGLTIDGTLVNNRAHAVIRVVHPPSPPVVCPSVRQPRAHAAC